MTDETCPNCNQMLSKSFHYRRGEVAGRKIIEQCEGDEKKRAGWLRFLGAYCEVFSAAPTDALDYLEGTRATVEQVPK